MREPKRRINPGKLSQASLVTQKTTPSRSEEEALAIAFAEMEQGCKLLQCESTTASSNAAIENWRSARRPFQWSACGHTCKAGCQMSRIVGTKAVFGCEKTGVLHQCGDACERRAVNQEAEIVCVLTGAVLGKVMMDEWAEALGSIPTALDADGVILAQMGARKKYTNQLSRTTALSKQGGARGIVRKALYTLLVPTGTAREQEELHARITVSCGKAITGYVRECASARKWPLLHEARRLVHCVIANARLSGRSPCSDERLEFYTEQVLELWNDLSCEIPVSQRTEATVQTFALGAVYRFQHGIIVAGNVIAEPDHWLFHNLPQIATLVHLGFKKKAVTTGRNLIYTTIAKKIDRRRREGGC